MKQVVFWSSILGISFILHAFYKKVSIMDTVFRPEVSSIWFDVVFIVLFGYGLIDRLWYFIPKIFDG